MAALMFSSFRRPSTKETGNFSEGNKVVKTLQIEVARLTDVLLDLGRSYGFDGFLLKMDT